MKSSSGLGEGVESVEFSMASVELAISSSSSNSMRTSSALPPRSPANKIGGRFDRLPCMALRRIVGPRARNT